VSRGNLDHVAIRVNDVEASTAFYSMIAAAAGSTIRPQTATTQRSPSAHQTAPSS
jgi:hypothetical protein